jgi:hypothetical protein
MRNWVGLLLALAILVHAGVYAMAHLRGDSPIAGRWKILKVEDPGRGGKSTLKFDTATGRTFYHLAGGMFIEMRDQTPEDFAKEAGRMPDRWREQAMKEE